MKRRVIAGTVVMTLLAFFGCSPEEFDPEKQPWYGTKACEEVPFAVEFRARHPYLAEYDRRVVFKSGKSASLGFDTGGAGNFAVYSLPDGAFLLMDGLRAIQFRGLYRVEVRAETVECLPNDTKFGVLRYLGLVTTSGDLVLGDGEDSPPADSSSLRTGKAPTP